MSSVRVVLGLGMVLLLAAPAGRSLPAPSLDGRPAVGFVDMERTPDTDPHLEMLVAEERYVQAFSHAVERARERLTVLGREDLGTLSAFRRVAVVAHLAGDQSLAACVLDTILPPLRRAGPPARLALAEALIRRGYVARYQEERDLATRLYGEAREILRRGPRDAPLEGFLRHATADWTRALDPARSIRLYDEAARLRQESPDVPWFSLADNETWAAWTLAREDRWDEARNHVEVARSILDRIGVGDHTLRTTLDELTAQDMALQNRSAAALAVYERAAERAERGRRRHAPGVPRSLLASEAFNALAVDAIRMGLDEHAWELRERGLGIVHAEMAWLGRADARDPAAAEEMRMLEHRLLDASREWERSPNEAVLIRMLETRARLDGRRTAFLDAYPIPQWSFQQVRASLEDRSALIGWIEVFVGDTGRSRPPASSTRWGFVLRRDRPIRWVHLGDTRGGAEWRASVTWAPSMTRLVRATSWPEHVLEDEEMVEGLAARTKSYFEPLRPFLEGVDRLIVDGNVRLLPEIFVGADGRYISDEFEIVHVPSAATLEILLEPRAEAPRPDGSILAVASGGATFSAGERENKRSVRTAFSRRHTLLADLPGLPFATVETASVADVFPSALRLEGRSGNDVRLAALASSGDIGRFDVIHLAGHALFDPAPERGAIVVGEDALVSVEDVALSWHLGARLVTFSACESIVAGGGVRRGEPMGFTVAALAAGAPNVLTSTWPVDDRATAILMRRFYEDLTGHYAGERRQRRSLPMPAAAALAEAKAYVRELRDASGARPFEHPAYWAGWMLMGTGD